MKIHVHPHHDHIMTNLVMIWSSTRNNSKYLSQALHKTIIPLLKNTFANFRLYGLDECFISYFIINFTFYFFYCNSCYALLIYHQCRKTIYLFTIYPYHAACIDSILFYIHGITLSQKHVFKNYSFPNSHSAISNTSIPSYVYFGCFVLATIIFG